MAPSYVWQEQYRVAILETDRTKLPQRIQAANSSIDDRLKELQMDHGGTPGERVSVAVEGRRL